MTRHQDEDVDSDQGRMHLVTELLSAVEVEHDADVDPAEMMGLAAIVVEAEV